MVLHLKLNEDSNPLGRGGVILNVLMETSLYEKMLILRRPLMLRTVLSYANMKYG